MAPGPLIDAALRENPHPEFRRMPGYRPRSNAIGRFWKKPRRGATRNRPFGGIADLKSSVRNGLRYFQAVRSTLLALINGRPKKSKI